MATMADYGAALASIQRGGYPEDMAERMLGARATHADTARSAALMPGETCPIWCAVCGANPDTGAARGHNRRAS